MYIINFCADKPRGPACTRAPRSFAESASGGPPPPSNIRDGKFTIEFAES